MNATRKLLYWFGAGGLFACLALAPAAKADNLPPNCETHPWGIFGLTQVRVICDGPILPDGSWMRHRVIGTPRHYMPTTTSCSGSAYYSSCVTYPGGWVDTQIADDETYPVRPETVLGDEPGHLGATPGPSTIA